MPRTPRRLLVASFPCGVEVDVGVRGGSCEEAVVWGELEVGNGLLTVPGLELGLKVVLLQHLWVDGVVLAGSGWSWLHVTGA